MLLVPGPAADDAVEGVMFCSAARCRGSGNSEAGSREASADHRERSPASRDALLRTRGVLAAARTRVVELEANLARCMRERAEQEGANRALRAQVQNLTAQVLEQTSAAEDCSRCTRCSSACYSPLASPLQAVEQAVARLESGLATPDVGFSPARTVTPKASRRPAPAALVARMDDWYKTSTVLLCWASWCSFSREARLQRQLEASEAAAQSAATGVPVEVHMCRADAAAHLVEALADQNTTAVLGNAWLRWLDMVERNIIRRRTSAEHASQCERLRLGAVRLACAASRGSSTASCLVATAWAAWRGVQQAARQQRGLAQRFAQLSAPGEELLIVCLWAWSRTARSDGQQRKEIEVAKYLDFIVQAHSLRSSAIGHTIDTLWDRYQADLLLRAFGGLQARARLSRQGKRHRLQLLEVLAPECALMRLCLAGWKRNACDSRMEAWSDRCHRTIEIRCEGMGAVASVMVKNFMIDACSIVFLAWRTRTNSVRRTWRASQKRAAAARSACLTATARLAIQVDAGVCFAAWIVWRHLLHRRKSCNAVVYRFTLQTALNQSRRIMHTWASLARSKRDALLAGEHRQALAGQTAMLGQLLARRALRQAAGSLRHAWAAWRERVQASGVLPRRACALVGLADSLQRNWEWSTLALIYAAWRALAAAAGPRFPRAAEEEPQTPCAATAEATTSVAAASSGGRRLATQSRRSSLHGRPPSAASPMTGASARSVAPRMETPSTAARRVVETPETGPRLPAEAVPRRVAEGCSVNAGSTSNAGHSAMLLRHVQSDPALRAKRPSLVPALGAGGGSPQAADAFHGRLAAALAALSASQGARAPASSRSSLSGQSDPEAMHSAVEFFPDVANAIAKRGGGSAAFTPREGGPAASDRSTCCPSTPRSTFGGDHALAVGTATPSDTTQEKLDFSFQTVTGSLDPRANLRQCQADASPYRAGRGAVLGTAAGTPKAASAAAPAFVLRRSPSTHQTGASPARPNSPAWPATPCLPGLTATSAS